MKQIIIESKDGQMMETSEKAFNSVYKSKGYKFVKEVEPEEIQDDGDDAHILNRQKTGGNRTITTTAKRVIKPPATEKHSTVTGEVSAADIAANLGLTGANEKADTKPAGKPKPEIKAKPAGSGKTKPKANPRAKATGKTNEVTSKSNESGLETDKPANGGQTGVADVGSGIDSTNN